MNLPNERVARLRAAMAEALEALQDWPWLDTLRTLRQRFREDRLGLTAGSLTFTTTMALVPLFTVMLAVFTAFPMFGAFHKSLERYFIQSLVPAGIAKPVMATLNQFAAKASQIGGLGLVAVVIAALALMLTIDRTLNNIWRVRKPRPIAYRVLIYWAAATLGPLVLGLSLSMTSWALTASKGWVGELPGGVKTFFGITQFVLMAVGMTALFRYVPNTHVRWMHAWAGGIFVAVGLELAKRLLAYYLGKVPAYSTIYGTFATVPILLLWIYLSWVIVLLGAVVAAYAPSLQMRVVRQPSTPGHRFTLAMQVLRALDAARRGDGRGLSLDQLASSLRIDPLQIEPVLELLMELDWVARLDEEGAARHVLLCEADTTPATGLVERLLLQPSPAVAGLWRQAALDRITLADLLRG